MFFSQYTNKTTQEVFVALESSEHGLFE